MSNSSYVLHIKCGDISRFSKIFFSGWWLLATGCWLNFETEKLIKQGTGSLPAAGGQKPVAPLLFEFIEVMLEMQMHSLPEFFFASAFKNFDEIDMCYFTDDRYFFQADEVAKGGQQ